MFAFLQTIEVLLEVKGFALQENMLTTRFCLYEQYIKSAQNTCIIYLFFLTSSHFISS